MAIQRAVVYGNIGGVIQTRNMFTANVLTTGGDTPQVLWTAYLESVFDPVMIFTSNLFSTSQYEIQDYNHPQWTTLDLVDMSNTGAISSEAYNSMVALVLVGKALGVRHMGRKFFSGLTETSVSASVLTASFMTNAAAALLAYITPFTGVGGGTITPGVVDAAGTFHAFVGGFVSSLLGTCRRRKVQAGI